MSAADIGVDVDDLRLPPKEALRQAADLQFHVVEMATVEGDVAPWNLLSSGRRHLARYTANLGLRFAALTADMPDLRFTDPKTVDECVERTLRVLELAADMHVPIVTASVGAMVNPATLEPSELALDALGRVGEFADSCGRVYGIRPSYNTGGRLRRVLDGLDCPAIRVCLDPAAMVMTGVNPVSVFHDVADRIALVHARDATVGTTERCGREVPLGEGEVDLVGILAMLDAADYGGAYIIRQTSSESPMEDIQAARSVLARSLPPG
jgi:sugar phosphate isomerase/epimerase